MFPHNVVVTLHVNRPLLVEGKLKNYPYCNATGGTFVRLRDNSSLPLQCDANEGEGLSLKQKTLVILFNVLCK